MVVLAPGLDENPGFERVTEQLPVRKLGFVEVLDEGVLSLSSPLDVARFDAEPFEVLPSGTGMNSGPFSEQILLIVLLPAPTNLVVGNSERFTGFLSMPRNRCKPVW